MSHPSVVHCRRNSYDIYIGRPSKWGNPFSHQVGTQARFRVATRDQAVERYEEWILYGGGMSLVSDLDELIGKVLGCWCAPKRCHGDVLATLAAQL